MCLTNRERRKCHSHRGKRGVGGAHKKRGLSPIARPETVTAKSGGAMRYALSTKKGGRESEKVIGSHTPRCSPGTGTCKKIKKY